MIDTRSDEFQLAQAHMSLRQELRDAGVHEDKIEDLSDQIGRLIDQSKLDGDLVCEIECEFETIWYPKLGIEKV